MKVLQIAQNSEEWFEFRKGKSGGSEFKKLWSAGLPLKSKIIEKLEADGQPLTTEDKKSGVETLAAMLEPEELAEIKVNATPKKHYYELIAERVARPITPNDYIEELNGEPFSMAARGHILEPIALEAFAKKTGKTLDAESVVWVSDDNDDIYISPDGTITSHDGKVREAVEVKCLNSAEIIEAYLTQKYPAEYYPQILKYFIVNQDLEVLYLVLYTDVIPGLETQIFMITRDEVADSIEEARIFEEKIMKRIENDSRKILDLGF